MSARCDMCGESERCNISETDTLVFKVQKSARGEQGRWFFFSPVWFHHNEAARQHFAEFSAEQDTGPGLCITLREVNLKTGESRLLAKVGGV